MGTGYSHKTAKTIGDLLSILIELKDSGYDMSSSWNGFDDGSIYIHPKNEQWIAIDSDHYSNG